MKWYFYIDWGSGYTLVNATNLKGCFLKLKRNELNDFVQRKKMEGSFTLIDSDSSDAETYFVTNGNFEVPIRVYENGISGVGTLVFEGWARKNGQYDFRRNQISLSNFRTNDQYEEFLQYIDNRFTGEQVTGYGANVSPIGFQGQAGNASKLHRFTWSGSAFSLVGSLSVPNLGGCSATIESGEYVVFDNVNNTLKGYTLSGTSFAESRSIGLSEFGSNNAIVGIGTSRVRLIRDRIFSSAYAFSGSTFTLLGSTFNVDTPDFNNPKVCGLGLLVVDERTGVVQTLNGQYTQSFGNIQNPAICVLDSSTNAYALIDSNQQKLIAFTFSSGVFTEIGSLQLGGLYSPQLAFYSNSNIVLHDTISSKLEFYNYSAGTFTKTGSTYSIGGGYTSSIAIDSGVIMLAITDTFTLKSSQKHNYYQLIKGLLANNGIDVGLGGNYTMATGTTNGATQNVDYFYVTNMNDISDNQHDRVDVNLYEFSLGDVLKYYIDLFQNYWYIDSSYNIKFTQPNLFSSFGTSYNISALDLATQLNQRTYNDTFNISSEIKEFYNAYFQDFKDNKIDYSRNTGIIQRDKYNFTTDIQYIINVYSGLLNTKIDSTGLMAYIIDNTLPGNTVASNTGIISGSDIKNYKMSQSQLYNDFMKDYRYQEQGNITINGSSSAVQDTVRNIIEFPEVRLSYNQLGISTFPASVANLTWDTGVVSFIEEFAVDMGTNEIIINSRLLDI